MSTKEGAMLKQYEELRKIALLFTNIVIGLFQTEM
jgi:hypothetical protein